MSTYIPVCTNPFGEQHEVMVREHFIEIRRGIGGKTGLDCLEIEAGYYLPTDVFSACPVRGITLLTEEHVCPDPDGVARPLAILWTNAVGASGLLRVYTEDDIGTFTLSEEE